MSFLTLILSLPTENATVRQRAWRALKASGAAVLRDGVYLMPDRTDCRQALEATAAEVIAGGGAAHVLRTESEEDFTSLFDRSADYASLLERVVQARASLSAESAHETLKQARRLHKSLLALSAIDFFPGAALTQARTALEALEEACARAMADDEPVAVDALIPRRLPADYQQRLWATRRRPWVDRLACAWLIRRFIDPHARILWLAHPNDCPVDALGFDFDGATFTHVGGRVSYEVLLQSFDLQQPGLLRLGALVHYLDVGGIQPPEAAGVESVLAGLRAAIEDDDRLLAAADAVFDGLFTHFNKEVLVP